MINANLKLIATHLSPYCVRVEMAMIEKKISYEKEIINLANKPDWFVRDAPAKKVPLLYIDGDILFESVAICEYLEEASKSNPLHSTNILTRNTHRAWMQFSNDLMSSVLGLIFVKNAAELDFKRIELINKIKIFDQNLKFKPYFDGDNFLLVDIFMASVLKPLHYMNQKFTLNIFSDCKNINFYSQNLLVRDSLIKSIPQNYEEIFDEFLRKFDSYLLKTI